MAFSSEVADALNFKGLKFEERNTFLHFFDDAAIHPRKCRSRSAPATVRVRVDSSFFPVPLALSEVTEKHTSDLHSMQAEESIDWVDNGDVQTVMIRGIPCSCKVDEILEAVKGLGFHEHEFFYAPTKRGRTLGYAFISFPDSQLTKDFTIAMTGYIFSGKLSSKYVTVTPASIQGFSNNFNHFRGTSVMQSAAKPLFIQQGPTGTIFQ